MDIIVHVVNQTLHIRSNLNNFVEGSQNFVRFSFVFTSEWEGLKKFAQFRQNGHAYNIYLDENNCVYLPPEITAGSCMLMLYGSVDSIIGTTNYLTLKINKNHLITDAESTEISESLYNQLVTSVSDLENRCDEIGERVFDLESRLSNLEEKDTNGDGGEASGGSCGCSITVARKGSEAEPVSLSGYGIGAGDVVRFPEGDYYVEPFDMEGLDHVTFLLGDARIHCAGDHFLEATRCDDLQIIGGTVMGGKGTVMGVQIKDCLRPVLRQVCFNGIGSATLEDTKGLTILGDCTGFLVDRCVVDGVSAGVVSSDGWIHAYGILVNRLGSTNAYSRKGQILHCRIANVAGIDTDTVKADGDGIFVQRPPYLDDSGKVAGIDQVIDIDGCVFKNCKKRGVKSAAWGTTVRDCVFEGEFYYAAVDLQYGHGTVDRCRIYNASNYTKSVTSGVVANDGGFTVRDTYINCLYVNEDGTNGRHPGVRMDKRQPGSIFDKTVPWDPILVERCHFDQINYGVYAGTSVSGVDTYRLTALEVLDCRWGAFYHGYGVFISSTVFDEVDVARFVDFRFDAGDTAAEVQAVNSNFTLPIMVGADPTKAYEIHSRYWLDKVVTSSNTPTAAHTSIVSVGEGCRKEYTAYGSRIWGSGDPNVAGSSDAVYQLLRGSKVGDEYTDTATGRKYTCTAAGGVGVWEEMGSDATVTAASVNSALGYVPVDPSRLRLGYHTDGLVYIFVGDTPVGSGIEIGADGDVIGYVDSGNNIVVKGSLADGTYTVKYEMEDGSTIDIGELVLDANVYCSVSSKLTNCVNSNSATQVIEGESYSAQISANDGYELSSVIVAMGGMDVSASVVSGGTISIAEVTGDIVITAVAVETAAEPTYTNLFAPADAVINKRYNSNGELVDLDGYVAAHIGDISSYVPFTDGTKIYIKGASFQDDGKARIFTYKTSGTDTTGAYSVINCNSMTITDEGNGVESVSGIANTFASGIKRLAVTMKVSASAMTASDLDDIVVTIEEPIV